MVSGAVQGMGKHSFIESYTLKVQKELVDILIHDMKSCCYKAFISGIIKSIGYLQFEHKDNKKMNISIELKSKKLYILRKIFPILKDFFNSVKISYKEENVLKPGKTYFLELSIPSVDKIEKVLNAKLTNKCCKKRFIGTCFIFNGMITYEKQYSVKIFHQNRKLLNKLKSIIKQEMGLSFNIYHLKKQDVLLGQGINVISNFFNYFGLVKELLNLENIKILKEIKNKTNRLVNCETGNLKKIIKSCNNQLTWIEYLKERGLFPSLSPRLKEASLLRLKYPEASLIELCEYSNGRFTKSSLNHCFRRLKKIYEDLINEKKDFNSRRGTPTIY